MNLKNFVSVVSIVFFVTIIFKPNSFLFIFALLSIIFMVISNILIKRNSNFADIAFTVAFFIATVAFAVAFFAAIIAFFAFAFFVDIAFTAAVFEVFVIAIAIVAAAIVAVLAFTSTDDKNMYEIFVILYYILIIAYIIFMFSGV